MPSPSKTSTTASRAVHERFSTLLKKTPGDEHAIQECMESDTELIPTPLLLNHGLHFNAVISKLPISASLVCDFAYLTKSTVGWRLVYIE